MADTTILRGRILDADGEPMANQPISNPFSSSSSSADRTALAKVFKQRPDLHTTTTGADGNFTVRCIANIKLPVAEQACSSPGVATSPPRSRWPAGSEV